MSELDLDAIEQRFGADVRARCYHDPVVRDVLALTNEIRRLHSWGGLLSLLDQHWPVDVFPTPEGLDAARSTNRRDTGPVVLGLIRWVDKLAAERDCWREEALRKYPTPEAYDAACAALQKHRERAEAAEQAVARVREVCEATNEVTFVGGIKHRAVIVADLRRALDGPAAPKGASDG